jgi:hypothetical protein
MTIDRRNVWKVALVLILVLIAVWVPRILSLDQFATPDEAAWVGRSASFYYALAQRDYANTFQHSHPGVMVTWAGTAAYRLRYLPLAWEADDWIHGNWKKVEPFLKGQGISPLEILKTARIIIVLGTTLAVGLAFVAAVRLVGLWVAFIGFLLIAFDPFHAGLTRILHHDGLESGLMFLSFLSFLVFVYRGHCVIDLVIAGLSAGLSWLTKSPALYLIAFFSLIVLIEILEGWLRKRSIRAKELWNLVWPLLVVGGIGVVVFIVLWPAMWVDPLGTLDKVFRQALFYASEGHVSEIFFNGRIIKGDPGWNFYPVTFLWRTTPIVIVGLVFTIIGGIWRKKPFNEPIIRRVTVLMALYAVLFLVAMSLGAKKFDRYVIPIYLPIDLLAGMGWYAAARWIWDQTRLKRARWLAVLLLILIVGLQAVLMLRTCPYYLSFYNPLMGGSAKAPDVMMIGWGEGLDQAARYLNTKPDAEQMRVMSHYSDGSFSYFFQGETVDLVDSWEGIAAQGFDEVDYVVLYYHQWQRKRPDPEMLAFFAAQTPEYVVNIDGLDYALIYDIQELRP